MSEQTLVAYNPTMADVLKADQNVKIPVPAPQMQPDEAPLTARQEKKLRKKFILHTVEAHETLYAISKRYGISVETLLEDNENLDPTHLTIGGTLLVRKKEVGKTSNAENLAELEEYKEKLNSVPTDGFRYYVVRPGDTMYSLAHANRTTEQTLSELNEGLSSATLKAGAIIKLPTADAPATAEQPADTLTVRPPAEKLLTLAPDAALRLSLLLPATTDGRPNASYTEFYQGFLLGVDRLRRDGRSVRLDVFDTAHDPAKVATLVADSTLARSQLIVGPVYEDELAPVLRIAEQEGIPVVSPLATIDHSHSVVLFQMAPDPARKYAKLARPLNSGRRVVLIYSQHTDTAFEQAVKALIPDVGYETFRYEQGSNIGSILSARDSALLVVLSGKETEVDPRRTGLGQQQYHRPRPLRTAVRRHRRPALEPVRQHRPQPLFQESGEFHIDLSRQTRRRTHPHLRQPLYLRIRFAADALLLSGVRRGRSVRLGDVRRHQQLFRRRDLHAAPDALPLYADGRRQPRQHRMGACRLQRQLYHHARIIRPWHLPISPKKRSNG